MGRVMARTLRGEELFWSIRRNMKGEKETEVDCSEAAGPKDAALAKEKAEEIPGEGSEACSLEPSEAPSADVSDPAAEDPSLEDKLGAALAEASENRDRYLRTASDLENYRRRVIREKDELRRFAVSGLVEELLPVLDNLELGLDSAREQHPEAKAVTDGFAMAVNQFLSVLNQQNLKAVAPIGERFDPNLHECVAHQPSREVEEGKVMAVTRKGYTLNERLLRPASVIVSSGVEAEEE